MASNRAPAGFAGVAHGHAKYWSPVRKQHTVEKSMSFWEHHTEAIRDMLRLIGEDPERDGLRDTPGRVIRSWSELFAGYRQDPKAILATVFDAKCDEIVVLDQIDLFSTCEHHLLPIVGRAKVGYLPSKGKIVGLSKLARLVECFARRIQTQERLTQQITEALAENLKPMGCGVVIEASHHCMIIRGIKKANSRMVTSCLLGLFRTNDGLRREFLDMESHR